MLVEGVSDLIYLQIMSSIVESAGKNGLSKDITIVPTGGLDKVATFISLLRGNELQNVSLLDSFTDPKGKAKLDNLVAKIFGEILLTKMQNIVGNLLESIFLIDN